MKISVRLFARAKDLAGTGQVELEVPDSGHVADVKNLLGVRFPNLTPLLPTLLVAIGTSYADDRTPLTPSTELACFPPVSGG